MRNVLWILVLAACGGSSTPPTTPPPQQPLANTAPETPPAGPPEVLPGLDASVCAQRADSFGPVPLNEAQLAQRRGTGATRFDLVVTTKEAPIEVCMPPGQRAWLATVSCKDGTRPTSAQRGGSVGAGGSCGSIIDLYEVVCPEKTYEVYMDMYMCPAE